MKSAIIGAHLRRQDVEPITEAIPVGELFLSGVPLADDRPLGDRDLLLQIAGVRARLLDRATFVAIRYGFVVHSPEEALFKSAVQLPRWRELLIRHRDEFEMTLKAAAASPAPRPDRHDFPTGAEYMRALQKAAHAVDVDPRFRRAIEETIVPLATQHRWIHRDNASVELAMLVRRSDAEKVRQAGERLRGDVGDVPFLLSGPWPLEVFADDDHQ
jgi:hypothetical protein